MRYDQKNRKTLVFLNLRFSDFYSKELFKRLKDENDVRLVAIVDQQFNDRVGQHLAPYLDRVYKLQSEPKDGFLGEFSYSDLSVIVNEELNQANDLRLICSDEFNLLNAGKLRREFCLEGHDDTKLLVYRDKVLMKEVLARQGLRVPRFLKIEKNIHFDQVLKELDLPFIIKPIDSCGSHGIHLIKNFGDYEYFINSADFYYSHWEAEEFIQGTLFHVDSLIRDGDIQFICANEYTCPNHEYVKGSVLGSITLPDTNHHAIRLIHFAKKCLKVLGANNMVNHMELFINQRDEIVFLEVSARPPGGYLTLIHKINFGVNLMDEDFFMQSGEEVSLSADQLNSHAFFAIFPLRPGKIVELKKPVVQSRCDLTWHVSEGDTIYEEQCSSVVGKSAHAIFYNEDMRSLRADFEAIKTHQAVKVV